MNSRSSGQQSCRRLNVVACQQQIFGFYNGEKIKCAFFFKSFCNLTQYSEISWPVCDLTPAPIKLENWPPYFWMNKCPDFFRFGSFFGSGHRATVTYQRKTQVFLLIKSPSLQHQMHHLDASLCSSMWRFLGSPRWSSLDGFPV